MLTPIAKRLLIQGVEEKHGTLILSTQKFKKFVVRAIGDEITKVKVGNVIFLEKHYGIEIDHENEKFLVIDESSILAKLD